MPTASGLTELRPTEWTVTDASTTDNDDVACVRTGVAGKSHYITFLCMSTDNTTTGTPVIKAFLKDHGIGTDDADSLIQCWPIDIDASPTFVTFPNPIRITPGSDVTFEGDAGSGSDQIAFSMGGYTA
jgi:hypothetical protein